MSDESKFVTPAVDLPAEWLRELARSAQHAEFIEEIKRAAEAIDGCVEATKRKCSGWAKEKAFKRSPRVLNSTATK
jgi:hypothetical protein